MPQTQRRVHRALVTAFAALVIAFAANVMSFINTHNAIENNCKSINVIHEGIRLDAMTNFAELDENAALLGLPPISEAARDRARRNLLRTLNKYQAKDCDNSPLPGVG